uniref:Uncharacterized protein n=1 Tax=Aegilops tauschii subsp. strangulata TaxID=200361 RepID=A0A453L0W1_AEGTS
RRFRHVHVVPEILPSPLRSLIFTLIHGCHGSRVLLWKALVDVAICSASGYVDFVGSSSAFFCRCMN